MMNKGWENEFGYQLTMSLVRQLRTNGTVSEDEYMQIDAIMLRKYQPVLGTLLAGEPLAKQNNIIMKD